MTQTKAGGSSVRQTMIKKFGSAEAYRAHMRRIAAKGGARGHTGGFYADRKLARLAGAKGGRISRRGKSPAKADAAEALDAYLASDRKPVNSRFHKMHYTCEGEVVETKCCYCTKHECKPGAPIVYFPLGFNKEAA